MEGFFFNFIEGGENGDRGCVILRVCVGTFFEILFTVDVLTIFSISGS